MERLTYWKCKEKGSALPVAIDELGDTVDLETLCAKLAAYEDTGIEPEYLIRVYEICKTYRRNLESLGIKGFEGLKRISELLDAEKQGCW